MLQPRSAKRNRSRKHANTRHASSIDVGKYLDHCCCRESPRLTLPRPPPSWPYRKFLTVVFWCLLMMSKERNRVIAVSCSLIQPVSLRGVASEVRCEEGPTTGPLLSWWESISTLVEWALFQLISVTCGRGRLHESTTCCQEYGLGMQEGLVIFKYYSRREESNAGQQDINGRLNDVG